MANENEISETVTGSWSTRAPNDSQRFSGGIITPTISAGGRRWQLAAVTALQTIAFHLHCAESWNLLNAAGEKENKNKSKLPRARQHTYMSDKKCTHAMVNLVGKILYNTNATPTPVQGLLWPHLLTTKQRRKTGYKKRASKTKTITRTTCGQVSWLSVSRCVCVWVAAKRQKLAIINSLLKTSQVAKVNKKSKEIKLSRSTCCAKVGQKLQQKAQEKHKKVNLEINALKVSIKCI